MPCNRHGAICGKTLWGRTGSSSSNTPRPTRRRSTRCSSAWGLSRRRRHRSKNVTLYKQGDVNFIVNAEPESFAQAFARLHGPSVCAIAFRVDDAAKAYERAISLGAKPVHGKVGPMELNIPAIEGIGGSLIYLVDRYGERTIYDVDFVPLTGRAGPRPGSG